MSQLTLVGGNSLLRGMPIDWDEQHDIIEKIEKNVTGESFHTECATEACRQLLIRAESGEIIEDVASELKKERMLAIYKVRVEEAPIASFCKNVDYESLKQLHESVKYYISKEFENNFASVKSISTDDLLDIDIIKI